MLSQIQYFCSIAGHEYFTEVPESFIEDQFNLTGLNGQVPFYQEAMSMILDGGYGIIPPDAPFALWTLDGLCKGHASRSSEHNCAPSTLFLDQVLIARDHKETIRHTNSRKLGRNVIRPNSPKMDNLKRRSTSYGILPFVPFSHNDRPTSTSMPVSDTVHVSSVIQPP